MLRRILARLRGDLDCKQVHDDAVFVGRPNRTVVAQERCSRRLLAAEAHRAVKQSVDKPFETNRNFAEFATNALGDVIDQRARHERLADHGIFAPARAMREQILDSDRQIMVRIHQARRRDDAVTVIIGVVSEGDIVFVFDLEEICHSERRRAVHANFAVVILRHKAERIINVGIDNLEPFDAVSLRNRHPIIQSRAAHGIGADVQAGFSDRVHVNDACQCLDVRHDIIEEVNVIHLDGFLERNAFNLADALFDQLVGAVLNFGRGLGACGTAVGRIIFDAAVGRRVMRRSDDHAVSLFVGAAIVFENLTGDDRSRNGSILILQNDLNAVGGKNFDAGTERGLGERVSVGADVERSLHSFCRAVLIDCLSDCKDMLLVETVLGRAAAMPRGTERYLIGRVFGIGFESVIITDQCRNVDDVLLLHEEVLHQ